MEHLGPTTAGTIYVNDRRRPRGGGPPLLLPPALQHRCRRIRAPVSPNYYHHHRTGKPKSLPSSLGEDLSPESPDHTAHKHVGSASATPRHPASSNKHLILSHRRPLITGRGQAETARPFRALPAAVITCRSAGQPVGRSVTRRPAAATARGVFSHSWAVTSRCGWQREV